MKSSSPLSRREKLLLGLLTSTLVFSASFSYGAVNSNKVDAIMKMITDGGAKFSDIPVSGQTKSERTSYYEKVDAGLGDAVEMLAVVRNNIRSLMGLSPAYTADDVVGGILGGLVGGVSGGNGSGNNPGSGTSPAGSSWSSATSISCPTSTGALQSANPSTVSSTNSTGFHYTNVGGVYFNVKNYANASDTSLPTSCTAGQKWIAKSGTNSCSVYSCGSPNGGAGTSGNPGNTSVAKKYFPVSGSEFALSQGKISQSDIPGAFVNEGGILYFPWEKKAMAAYPECTNQKALDACTVTNSACWKKSSYEKGGGTFHQRDWLACKEDVDIGIFANDPIPAPCPADTKLMNEIFLSNDTSGGWIRRPWYVNTATSTRGINHVYRLLLMDPDTTKKDSYTQIETSDYGVAATLGLKISPYPCDFADLSKTQYGQDGACGVVAPLGPNLRYTYEGNPANPTSCILKKGVTYYVNVSSTGALDEVDRTAYGKYPGAYQIQQNNSMDKVGGPHYAMWGIYDTFEKWALQQNKGLTNEGNISSQSAESLRQKVVNDYKTTGKNSEKLTIPLFTNTIKDINRTISNAKCEMLIDTTVHASITKFYGKYGDATSPADTYYDGGTTIKKAKDFPLCASDIFIGAYTQTMMAPGELMNIGRCRTADDKVLFAGFPPDCKTLCSSIGGNDGNGWCEPNPGGLFQ